jgi:hypothetical protein
LLERLHSTPSTSSHTNFVTPGWATGATGSDPNS